MKPLTVYVADDGARFDTAAAALERDALIEECQAATTFLRHTPTDDGCAFANGGGFLQQPTGSRQRLLTFLEAKGVHRDSNGPLGLLLYRLHCIDTQDREWGQPFFALHPHRGKQVAV